MKLKRPCVLSEVGDKTPLRFGQKHQPRKMEGALSSLGMSRLTLRGTVFERRRAIRQFHAPGPARGKTEELWF
jgi:hypothetical protein